MDHGIATCGDEAGLIDCVQCVFMLPAEPLRPVFERHGRSIDKGRNTGQGVLHFGRGEGQGLSRAVDSFYIDCCRSFLRPVKKGLPDNQNGAVRFERQPVPVLI